MNATLGVNKALRVNEALMLAKHAVQPFQCIAWAPQDGNGELSLTVIDRTCASLGRARLACSTYADPRRFAQALLQLRADLSQSGHQLQPWSMPA